MSISIYSAHSFRAFPSRGHLPLAVLSFLLLICAAMRAHVTDASRGKWIVALLLPPALIVASVVTGFALHFIAQSISGQPDPSYAYPIALREGLAFGVLAMSSSDRTHVAAHAWRCSRSGCGSDCSA